MVINLKPRIAPKRLLPDVIPMSNDMKDQELDRLMRQIAEDASLDEASADEIADSPALWWNVQREVRTASSAKSPWPPNVFRRWLIVGLPVAAAIALGLGVYLGSSTVITPEVTNLPSSKDRSTPAREPESNPTERLNRVEEPDLVPAGSKGPAKNEVSPRRAVLATKGVSLPRSVTASSVRPKVPAEIRSDFLALAYASDPDSGQIVRVKVPSSMMIQLGVVATVESPSALVDAEVLVGDDGLTHAIRFIRQ